MAYVEEQSYTTDLTAYGRVDDQYQKAQTFEDAGGFTLIKVEALFKCNEGAATGELKCYIYSTSSSLPDSELAEAENSVAINSITTDAGGEWLEFTFAGVSISAATEYAIVFINQTVAADDQAVWFADGSSPTYSNGEACYSTDSGSNWTSQATHDYGFKVYSGSSGAIGIEGSSSLSISAGADLTGTFTLAGSSSITIGSTADIYGAFGLVGTSSILFGSSATLVTKMKGSTIEKYHKRLITCSNDAVYFEDL